MQSNQHKLVNIATLSEHNGVPARTLRTFMASLKLTSFLLGKNAIT